MNHVIDTHAHVYPARYLDLLEELGADPATTKIARGLHADDTDADIERRLAMMDAAGVRLQVLSATPQTPQLADPAKAARAARAINDIYRDLLARYPERFRALGTLPLPHVEESLAEIAYVMDDLGWKGVALNAFVGASGALTDEALQPVFEELDRRGAVVYLHPAGLSAGCPAISEHELTWVNGAPMEDAIATLHLLKADYPHRFPRIRFHVAHLGGDLPFLAQRIQDNYDDWGSFESSPAQTLRTIWFDAANFFTPSLRLALEVYDPAKVMAGSDFPYFQDEKYTRAVTYVEALREHGIDAEQIDAILTRNAVELYGPFDEA